MPWKHPPSASSEIFEATLADEQDVVTVFSNQKDVILVDFHHHGDNVPTEYNCGTVAWLG
jgi:hypothetical protein